MRRTLVAFATSLLLLGVGTVAPDSAAQRSAPVPKSPPQAAAAARSPRPAPAIKALAPVSRPNVLFSAASSGCPGNAVGSPDTVRLVRMLTDDPVVLWNLNAKIPEFRFDFFTYNDGKADAPASRLVVMVNDRQVATVDEPPLPADIHTVVPGGWSGVDVSSSPPRRHQVRFPPVTCLREQHMPRAKAYGSIDWYYCVVNVKVYVTPPPPPCPQGTICAALIGGTPAFEGDACILDSTPSTGGSVGTPPALFIGHF